MSQWNIYCETEQQVVSVWSPLGICSQSCPNDPSNNYISRLSRVRFCNGTITSTNSSTYIPLSNYITQGSHIANYDDDIPVEIKIVASVDFGSYDFSFITVPDEVVLYESTNNINTTPSIISIPISQFINIPVTETAVDVRFRTSGGTVIVRNISVYCRVTPS